MSRTYAYTIAPDAIPPPPSYDTTFPADETVMSEGGAWVSGGAVGVDWNDFRTSGGLAFGKQATGSVEFDDAVAHLQGFPANHSAEVTIAYDGFYSSNTHEIECLVRFDITSGNARGYECLLAYDCSYAEIARWNGERGSYTTLVHATTGLPSGPVQTGDVIKASIVGNVITFTHKRGATTLTLATFDLTGSTPLYASGNPGMGSWHADNAGHLAASRFRAASL